jgi:hypothetical protein
MTLLAVETYVQGQLNGLTSSLFDPAEAWVLPPPVLYLTTPQLFVWGGILDEERHTLPRFLGYKRVLYQLTVKVQAATTNSIDPTEVPGPQAFPVLLDAVRKKLRTIVIAVNITDPVTGETSVIQTIGEKIGLLHPEPLAAADQRYLWHNATVKVAITESFVG